MGGASSGNRDEFENAAGPIERCAWGLFVIGGVTHSYEGGERVGAGTDIRVIGQEVTRWKERKGHRLKKSMITGVYEQEIEVLVIGNGVSGAVEVPDKVQRAIEEHGIGKVVVARTPEACRLYNRLYRKGKRVALLAHGTC